MWQTEMVERLRDAQNGEKDRIITEYETLTGKSAATLYRIAKQNGYDSGRKKRSDADKCALSQQQLSFISGLIHKSARELKGTIMPVEEALEIAEDNGIVERGTCSAAWVSCLLRRHNMHRAALDTPEPKIRMRSLHPNHVHVFDVSVCIQFYLKGRKGLRIMRETDFYKNKWQNFAKVKKKLLRYILTDHYSHTIFVKYYYTGGETQANLFDFLVSAWSGDKHPKLPFRGVPFFVLMDAGAANVSKAMLQWMERLDIEIPKALPHNAARQGSAEKAQEIVESRFESKLRFQSAEEIADLNDWALDWAVNWNSTKNHRRHGMTRMQCWLTIRRDQLRDLPDRQLLQDLFAEPEVSRLVNGDYTISFRAQTYDVRHIGGLIPNHSRVNVILRPFGWPQIGIVHNGTEHLVSPIGVVQGGFRQDAAIIGQQFKAVPESDTQKHKKRIDNLAFGEDRPKDAMPFEGITVFGTRADKVPHNYIPRSGTTLEIKSGDMDLEQQLPIITLIRELSLNIDMTPDLNQALREHYGTTISKSEHQRLLDIAAETGAITNANIQEGGNDTAQAIAI
jgi:hypothetical protein